MTLPLPPARLDVEANVADYGVGLAYAAHLGDEGRALSLLQIEAASWARAQRWPLRIADAVERGDRALVATFGAAFNETKARLAAATAEASAATGSAAREEVELGPGLLAQLSNEAVVNPPPPLARSERPAPVAPAAEPEPAPESAPPATAPAGEVNVESTLETPLPKITPPLPFAPAAASHAPSEKKPGGGPPPKRAPSSLGTTMPQQTIVPSPALPFRAPAPHELTLDQYASLCATLEAFPDKTAIILQRYGMTDPRDIDRLHETWQARFVNDTASLDAWTRHVAEIRARLRGKG